MGAGSPGSGLHAVQCQFGRFRFESGGILGRLLSTFVCLLIRESIPFHSHMTLDFHNSRFPGPTGQGFEYQQ